MEISMKTKVILPFFCLLAIIVAGALIAGCTTSTVANPGIAGKYVNEDNSKSFIELNGDGTFYYRIDASSGYTGKWEMKANALRLHTETMGITIELEKRQDTLLEYNNDGRVRQRFVKED
jgi:hypothetical protein